MNPKRGRCFLIKICICSVCLLLGFASQTHADLFLDDQSIGHAIPDVSSNEVFHYEVPTKSISFQQIISANEEEVQSTADSTVLAVVGRVLNYPNPFSMQTGTKIGYELTKAAEIELKIYTLTGYLVYHKTFASTEEGGLGQYNRIPINAVTLEGQWLAPGVYLYGVFSGGKLLSKNRMVVTP